MSDLENLLRNIKDLLDSLAPNQFRTFLSLLDNLLKSSTHSEINGFYFDQLQTEIQPWMRDQVVKWMLEVSYYVIVLRICWQHFTTYSFQSFSYFLLGNFLIFIRFVKNSK